MVMKRALLLSVIVFSSISISSIAFAEGDHSKDSAKSSHMGHHSSDMAVPQSFVAPKPYDHRELYEQIKISCPSQALECYEGELFKITDVHGPKAAMDVFAELQKNNEVNEKTDGHHVAHHIGHQIAKSFGPFPETLAMCPKEYNFGCIHGFFQYSLDAHISKPEVLAPLCQVIEDDPHASVKDKVYCFHGLGHGVMMYYKYDMQRALAYCDAFDTVFGRDGCWQGLFMENMNGAFDGNWEETGFSKEDPLLPCSALEEKHQEQCFINHSSWMIDVFDQDYIKAIEACRKAPSENSQRACIESITLMVSNPSFQSVFLSPDELKKHSVIENAATICNTFPPDYQDLCVNGAVDNIANFDDLDLTGTEQLCHLVDERLKPHCFKRIGSNLINIAHGKDEMREACNSLKEKEDVQTCLEGANINNQ